PPAMTLFPSTTLFRSGRATVDRRAPARHGLGIGPAASEAALGTLRLRQQGVNTVGEGSSGHVEKQKRGASPPQVGRRSRAERGRVSGFYDRRMKSASKGQISWRPLRREKLR